MSNTLHFAPASLRCQLTAEDGVTGLVTATGEPPGILHTGITRHLRTAFTPTATTVLLCYEGGYTFTGATARGIASTGADIESAKLRHLRLWARRKPGTTGTIAASTIAFGASDGVEMTQMGLIKVAAAASGEEPVSDVFDMSFGNGHLNFTMSSSEPFMLQLSAVDPDLELVLEAYGTEP